MKFIERVKNAWAALAGETAGMRLPVGGRSSEESLSSGMALYNSFFGAINPVIDFEALKTLKHFWLYNPDVSQYVANIVNLGNPGHTLSIDARNDAAAEAAVNRLNESAVRIYPQGCGVDGLIDQYIISLAWSGAISSEDVVNLPGRRVEKVVEVPVEQIRFKYNKETDSYDPYQRSNNLTRGSNLIPLNPETYKYVPLSTIQNSPYAKPPATACISAILEGQEPLMQNLRFIAQKFGLLGLVTASVTPPTKLPGETLAEYQARCVTYLESVNTALDGNFNKGLLTAYRDIKFEHTNVAEGATGLYDANRISEEQVFSGLGAQPGFHGRTDSTTETFADVVYYLLTAQVGKMQRPVKRRMEGTYRLDLRLGGTEVDGVSLSFNKAHSRNAKEEAETEKIRLDSVVAKVEKGIISPDEGAQELGYDAWFDETLLGGGDSGSLGSLFASGNSPQRHGGHRGRTINLSFDKRKQRYVYRPEQLSVISNLRSDISDEDGKVVPFGAVKKKAQLDGQRATR